MKTPEILAEKMSDREPVVQEYANAMEMARLKREILRQQIDGQKTERAMA